MASPTPDLIQDITTRFILTAPAEQLMFFESIMFLVEQAHWYFEDYVRDQDTSLRSLGLKEFAALVFQNCPELSQHAGDIEQIMEEFKIFKKNVPVMGGILLDQDMQRVLLVKGWKNTACWGFPRGKIHKNETDAQCAVREVLEETGYDIEELVQEHDFIELTLDGKRNKLFIVAGLDPNSAQFAPKCKGEIGGYAWHKVADLPATREEGNQTFVSDDGTKHKFFMVWPYLKPLRKWIKKQQLTNPEGLWDMPVSTTPPHQQQTQQQQPRSQPREKKGQKQQQQQQRSNGEDLWDMPVITTPPSQQQQHREKQGNKQQHHSAADGLWDMPVMAVPPAQQRPGGPAQLSPLPQIQQLAHGERRSGGGGSPKHTLHMQFHEAAIAQARQQSAVSTGPQLAAPSPAPALGNPGNQGVVSMHEVVTGGPLAKLFGTTMAHKPQPQAATRNDLLACTPGTFTFNRQQIMHALNSPVVALRHPISGRG